MRISVRKTGWFDGHTEQVADLDTAARQADGAMARQAEDIVSEIGFFSLPGYVGEVVGSDIVRYEVEIDEGGRQHTVTFAEDDQSQETIPVRRLVDLVSR